MPLFSIGRLKAKIDLWLCTSIIVILSFFVFAYNPTRHARMCIERDVAILCEVVDERICVPPGPE